MSAPAVKKQRCSNAWTRTTQRTLYGRQVPDDGFVAHRGGARGVREQTGGRTLAPPARPQQRPGQREDERERSQIAEQHVLEHCCANRLSPRERGWARRSRAVRARRGAEGDEALDRGTGVLCGAKRSRRVRRMAIRGTEQRDLGRIQRPPAERRKIAHSSLGFTALRPIGALPRPPDHLPRTRGRSRYIGKLASRSSPATGRSATTWRRSGRVWPGRIWTTRLPPAAVRLRAGRR